MTRLLCGLAALSLLAGTARSQTTPEDVIKNAVKAHGGEANLKKFPAGTSKIAGTVVGPKLPFTGAMAFAAPGKVRVEMTFEVGGQKATTIQTVNGDKVGQTENGKSATLTEAIKDELRESAIIQELALLYPLLDRTKFRLKAGEGGKYDDKDCDTVIVTAQGLKEVTLAFDRKTGLLTAMKRKGLSPAQAEVAEVTIFSDFKTIDGLVVPMKSAVSHDGRAFLELTVTEYKPLAKLDDKLFAVE